MKSVFDYSCDAPEELWVSEVVCTIGLGFDARGAREKGYRFQRFFEELPFLGGVIWMPISLNFFMKYSSSGSLVFFILYSLLFYTLIMIFVLLPQSGHL